MARRRSRAKAPANAKATRSRGSGQSNAKTKVFAPNGRFSGTRAGVVFKDGVGEVDRKADAAAVAYFERQGYGIGKKPKGDAVEEPERPVDAREAARVTVGTPLRDAAVDPRPEDFLAPVNAGKADPHGPLVVAPEIHHDSPKGLRPGVVHVDDPDQQEAEEKALAEKVLIEGAPKDEVIATFDPDESDMGPIGMSDPGSVEAGVAAAKADEAPAKNASAEAWRAHAVAHGMDPDEAKGASRADLIARFGG